MDFDWFKNYKKEQVSKILFDTNMVDFCENLNLKEYTNELN